MAEMHFSDVRVEIALPGEGLRAHLAMECFLAFGDMTFQMLH